MNRSTLPRLVDIDRNTKVVMDLTKNRTFSHFQHDVGFRYAVHYAVLIIAEAASHLPPAATDPYPDVPWRKILAIGDKLRHEYFRIDDDILWEVATVYLPPLRRVVKAMMATLPAPS